MPARTVLLAALLAQPDPQQLIPLYEQALAAREAKLGPDHPKVAQSAADLGLYLARHGDRTRAAALLRRALEINEKAFAPKHPRVIENLENLARVLPPREAIPPLERAAASENPAVSARSHSRLAGIYELLGDRAAAIRQYRLALTKEESATRLNDLALLLDPKEARPLLERALALRRKQLGAQHPETGVTMNNLANVLLALGSLAEAERMQRRALEILESALGKHARVAVAASNLADVLRAKGETRNARQLYERALAIDEKVYGPDHSEVAADLENLASLLEEAGDPSAARRLRERAARIKGR